MRKYNQLNSLNGHEYVDMGLSVMWATCNIGANCPEDYGDYYAWGETEMKDSYKMDNCKTWERSISEIKGTRMDAAHVKWGAPWRMPTKTEFEELLTKCEWRWVMLNDVAGMKVTSKINRNSIFLPAADWLCGSVSSLPSNTITGDYWSSTQDENDPIGAYTLFFLDYCHHTNWSNLYVGLPIRPVVVPKYNGHEYIDLGLSVKWATCNVGANCAEEYGDYFSWHMTKDAVALWGSPWRLPSNTDFLDLKNNCYWSSSIQNGTLGYIVTSKINGNIIFLPSAGWWNGDNFELGYNGYYWEDSSGWYAFDYSFQRDVFYTDHHNYGQSIRLVVE